MLFGEALAIPYFNNPLIALGELSEERQEAVEEEAKASKFLFVEVGN